MVPQWSRIAAVSFAVVMAVTAPASVETSREQEQIGSWTFTNLKTFSCRMAAFITGFQFDPSDRPVVGWDESGDCSQQGTDVFWSRLESGLWQTHRVEPGLTTLGGADNDEHHALLLSPDGTPWMLFSAIDGTSGDNNSFAFRTNLGASPTGSTYERLFFLIGAQNCNYTAYRPRFRAGDAAPIALTTRSLCSRGYTRMYLDSTIIADNLAAIQAADLAIDPGGNPHIIRITDGQPFYSTGSDGGVRLIDPRDGTLLALGRFASDAQLEVDANGLMHLVLSGLNEAGDGPGDLGYLTSADGVTWSPIEYIDQSRQQRKVTLTLDRNGAPAVAYWRASGEVRYATRASGAWTSSVVTSIFTSENQYPLELAFDAANVPAIAYFDPTTGANGAVRIARPLPAGVDRPIDLGVAITATPSTAAVDEPFEVRATATNHSGLHASGVTLTIDLPSGTSFLSSDPASAVSGRSATFNLGALNSGARRVVSLRMSSGSVRMLTTTATIAGAEPDPVPGNNAASVTTAAVGAACFPPTDGMQGWWRAENNTRDSIGGISAEVQGNVSYVEGIRGPAFQFDGATQLRQVEWGDSHWPGAGSMTLQAWVKTTSIGGAIAAKYDLEGFRGGASLYWMTVRAGGRLGTFIRPAWGSSVDLTGNAVIADGEFHHVAMVLDRAAAEVRLYVDGQLDATADASGMGPLQDEDGDRDPFTIGAIPQCCGPAVAFFTGVLDEVAISMRALSAAELEAVAAAPLVCRLDADADGDGVSDGVDACPQTEAGAVVNAQGCVLDACEVPLDGLTNLWPANRYGDDIVGGLEAFLMGGATYGPGLAGEAFKLHGGGAWINVPHHPSLDVGSGDFTVSLWVNFNSTSGEQILVEKYVEIWAPNEPGWLITKLADNRLGFYGHDGSPAISAPMAIPTNTWIHIAGVKRDGAITLLMNGAPIAAGTAGNVDSASSLKFGKRGGPNDTPGSVDTRGFFLNGSIDEVAFFRRGLSDEEIAGLVTLELDFCAAAPDPEPDFDGDGVPDNVDPDDDGDGQSDADESACGSNPLDATSRSADADSDGRVDCLDPDDDNDSVADGDDAFPSDPAEWADTDQDGIGNNADADDDGDGQSDADESACGSNPLDAASRSADLDGDGRVDCLDPDDDNDGVADLDDAFPHDASESRDADGDGIGDNADPDDNGNGIPDDEENHPANGRMHGGGFVDQGGKRYEFTFQVRRPAPPSDPSRLQMQIGQGRQRDRFVAREIGAVSFEGNVVTFSGKGEWNGLPSYSFVARAADVAEPAQGADTFTITIVGPAGAVVAAVDGRLNGGNVQKLPSQ